MKKFFVNLLILLIIALLFNVVVFVFSNDNYYKGYRNFPSKKFHSFIIADSHGVSLSNYCEKFNVYNFSTSSDSYLDMLRKVQFLIENEYQIDKIYLTVDGHTLSPYRDQFNNSDKSIIYTSDVNFNYLKEKYFKYYFPIFQVKVNSLFRNYMESKIQKIYPQKNKMGDHLTWNQLPEKERLKRASERAEGQFPPKKASEKLENTLLEIIKLCKSKNIELIGLKFPLSNDYLQTLNKRNFGADQLFISNGLEVLDYESVFRNKQEYYKDEDHLNFNGGEEFVKILLAPLTIKKKLLPKK